VIAQSRIWVGIIQSRRARAWTVVDREMCQQYNYFYKSGPNLVTWTTQQVIAESVHVTEQHVVGKPRTYSWRISQLHTQNVTPVVKKNFFLHNYDKRFVYNEVYEI
jgi:hypothetical protein